VRSLPAIVSEPLRAAFRNLARTAMRVGTLVLCRVQTNGGMRMGSCISSRSSLIDSPELCTSPNLPNGAFLMGLAALDHVVCVTTLKLAFLKIHSSSPWDTKMILLLTRPDGGEWRSQCVSCRERDLR